MIFHKKNLLHTDFNKKLNSNVLKKTSNSHQLFWGKNQVDLSCGSRRTSRMIDVPNQYGFIVSPSQEFKLGIYHTFVPRAFGAPFCHPPPAILSVSRVTCSLFSLPSGRAFGIMVVNNGSQNILTRAREKSHRLLLLCVTPKGRMPKRQRV